MRIKGNLSPNVVSVESDARVAGYAEVRLRENINAITVPDVMGGADVAMFEYDEYTLRVKDKPGLQAEIEADLNDWLATARSMEITGGESLVKLYEAALTELGVLPLEEVTDGE